VHRIKADPRSISAVDFPKLGFNAKWIVITASVIPTGIGNLPPPQENVYVFDKAALYAGVAQYRLFEEPSLYPAAAPVLTYDPQHARLYLVQTWRNDDNGYGVLRVSTIEETNGTTTLTLGTAFPRTTNPWSPVSITAPQLGSSLELRPDSFHVTSAVYRNGAIWCTHSVPLPAQGIPTRTAVQWWQFSPNGTVKQQGRIDDAQSVYSYDYASLAVNKYGDVLVGYSVFGRTIYPSAGYSFRKGLDARNSMRAPVILKSGTGAYSNARWGDYSSTVVDPSNDIDLWTMQQYSNTAVDNSLSGWGLWWGRIGNGASGEVCRLKS
jgi:hypothetical protein